MEPEIIATLTQFGVAGLIGWMWLTERRASAERDRQLSEAHARILRDAEQRTVLADALRDCTRAMVALECGQRALADLIQRWGERGHAASHAPAHAQSSTPGNGAA